MGLLLAPRLENTYNASAVINVLRNQCLMDYPGGFEHSLPGFYAGGTSLHEATSVISNGLVSLPRKFINSEL